MFSVAHCHQGPVKQNMTKSNPTSHSAKQSSNDNNSSPPQTANIGYLSLSAYNLGDINLFHGVPFLSHKGQTWVGFRRETVNSEDADHKAPEPLWSSQHHVFNAETLRQGARRELPPRNVLETRLALYQQSQFSSYLPLIDPVLFARTVEEAYKDSHPESSAALPAKACVFAFLALGSLVSDRGENPSTSPHIEGCDIAGQSLIPGLLEARPSIETVDALVMMVSGPIFLRPPLLASSPVHTQLQFAITAEDMLRDSLHTC